MQNLELMQDFSEIVQYERIDIPLYISTANLSAYPDMSAPCHWHEDIEWIHIRKGKMYYYINGKRIILNEKDSLMINARQMHYGYSFQKQDCQFSCILFHPALFCNNQALLQKYVTPVLKNGALEYLYIPSVQGQEVSHFLTQIVELNKKKPNGYELEIIALMHTLWSRLWQQNQLSPGQSCQEMPDDLRLQKDMVSFIYRHYPEKISLDEIAASGNVSRSKCCRIFKHYLQQSPIDFLNAYRLKISCNLLAATDKSVTEIALACGFNNLSYFSKYFCQHYGCTPRAYRNRKYQVSS